MPTRRQFLNASVATAVATILRRRAIAETKSPAGRINEAISSAVRYLTNRQDRDGAWRSEIYAPFKDGPSLTSLIAATLTQLKNIPDAQSTASHAVRYLAAIVSAPDQTERTPDGFTYPVYTAAGAVIALAQQPEFLNVRNAWLAYLRTLQLTDDLGWQTSDAAYGGWGYAATNLQPVNGAPATPLAVPNLSATVFALQALRTAGVKSCDPAVDHARTFVERCQNWTNDRNGSDGRFDDGGFHFLTEDPQRNKAGEVGIDHMGRRRFASYGSATADGLRALAYCGCGQNHPRRLAAESWLLCNFCANQHPGQYQPDREHLRPTLYYYFAASLSLVFSHSDRLRSRAPELAAALLTRQRPDGSWANSAVDVREDDPLVATPLAIQALNNCLGS